MNNTRQSRYSSAREDGAGPRGRHAGGMSPASEGGPYYSMPPSSFASREKLAQLPTFRPNLRNYSPDARRSGENILNGLKSQMRGEKERQPSSFVNFSGNRTLNNDARHLDGGGLKSEGTWPRQRMDGMRNRQQPNFPRMPQWMGDNDPIADMTSRMAPPNWPLGLSRRAGGPWRERRGSGGSLVTSEDDSSSYDAGGVGDKSSQGSGGSSGEVVTHEIPIMIEADAPPSMMMQQPQGASEGGQGTFHHADTHDGQASRGSQQPVGNPPTHGKHSLSEGSSSAQARASRCASAPPQMAEKTTVDAAPQMRSATMPLHNNVAKPFDPTYGSSSKQAPIVEETTVPPQQQCPQPQQNNQQQQQYPQQHYNQQPQPQPSHPQQQYYPQQQYPQQQHYPQQDYQSQHYPSHRNYQDQQYPSHRQHQQRFVPEQFYRQSPDPGYFQNTPPQHHYGQYHPSYDSDFNYPSNYYPEAPIGFNLPDNPDQHQQSSGQQKAGVVRNIPIFIEGQADPIINEERTCTSAPSTSPRTNTQPQFSAGRPERPATAPRQAKPQFPEPQRPAAAPTPPHHTSGPHSIPIKVQHAASGHNTPRQQSPAPAATPPQPPVKLTPLQKIDQIRANNEEILKKVDDFNGTTKKDREYLYLDEMLTRALISLDDIDPDGNDEIRQARRKLIKDINSKISLLDSKVTSPVETKDENKTVVSSCKAEEPSGKEEQTEKKSDTAPCPPQVSQVQDTSGDGKAEKGVDSSTSAEQQSNQSSADSTRADTSTPIPLPEK